MSTTVSQSVDQASKVLKSIIVLPVRNIVIYPNVVVPLVVSRPLSIKSLEKSLKTGKLLFLVAQKSPETDEPGANDIYQVGVLVKILQLLRLPNSDTVRVLVEGQVRAILKPSSRTKFGFSLTKSYYSSDIIIATNEILENEQKKINDLIPVLRSSFTQYIHRNPEIPNDLLSSLEKKGLDIVCIVDVIAIQLPITLMHKQKILETHNILQRLELVLELLEVENDQLEVGERIKERVKKKVEENHRKFYLVEQIDALQSELEQMGARSGSSDLERLKKNIKKKKMSAEAKNKAHIEYEKLKNMPSISAEATIIRNYLECLVDLPWNKFTPIQEDLVKAKQILDTHHYGLNKIKQRILEYLAVQGRLNSGAKNKKSRHEGTIFCFVGPPGVGKTSLGKSIAAATGRKCVRVALGGVRDEAEIRGHRRTYVGAMPGKIIQKLIKVGVNNPVFILDEVDKMAMDFRGDPASALLEVLDPEQNHIFDDHYLEVSYDLSHVMFIATANSLNIHPALLDRMEIIRLSGYTNREKLSIINRYILPKQQENHGLKKNELVLSPMALVDILHYYTREAGVRNLEREIAKICRKVVHKIAIDSKIEGVKITQRNIGSYLGVRRYRYDVVEKVACIGQVRGLAWTEVGGELLTIEAAVFPGRGRLIHTGSLGDVMQESIRAAMTVVRSYAQYLDLGKNYFQKHNIHIHVPEGATPKDGPSAGIGMCIAILSILSGISVHSDVAMTGEITLRGEILPIGGLKEKLLAALRSKIRCVLIPEENKKDLVDVPKEVKDKLLIVPVRWIEQALQKALIKPIVTTNIDDPKGGVTSNPS